MMGRARTPFERVRACPQADRERVARLEELRKSLDPFQLGKIIERKLLRISKLANRRQSPRAQQQEQAKTSQRNTGRKGCGKDARKKRGGRAAKSRLKYKSPSKTSLPQPKFTLRSAKNLTPRGKRNTQFAA
jgi:hypothetical protein